MARLPVAAVYVDLSARPWRTPHRVGGVLGVDCVDASGGDPVAHELDEVAPHGRELAATQGLAWTQWMDPVSEQQLGAVDVAHSG